MEAIRDHSKATGATRTVGFVLASYADKDGGGVYPGLTAICKGAGVGKKAAIDGRRWYLENGEAILVGTKPSRTGTPIPELDFSPLLRKGAEGEPLGGDKGSDSAPFDFQGFAEDTLKGSDSAPSRVRSGHRKGALSEPEPEGNAQEEPENETEDARGGARESGLSPASSGSSAATAGQEAAERREDEYELRQLEAQRDSTLRPEHTERCIAEIRERLGHPAEVAA
jgi:hypothetical protein